MGRECGTTSLAEMVLARSLKRLETVLQEENQILRGRTLSGHQAFVERKLLCLREIANWRRAEGDLLGSAPLKESMSKVRGLLADNARLLRLHINAVGEVADTIVWALKDAESDGTYARQKLIAPAR